MGRCIDDLDICLWRYDRFVELGVEPLTATALSLIADSPHQVEALVARGCSLELACTILV